MNSHLLSGTFASTCKAIFSERSSTNVAIINLVMEYTKIKLSVKEHTLRLFTLLMIPSLPNKLTGQFDEN